MKILIPGIIFIRKWEISRPNLLMWHWFQFINMSWNKKIAPTCLKSNSFRRVQNSTIVKLQLLVSCSSQWEKEDFSFVYISSDRRSFIQLDRYVIFYAWKRRIIVNSFFYTNTQFTKRKSWKKSKKTTYKTAREILQNDSFSIYFHLI